MTMNFFELVDLKDRIESTINSLELAQADAKRVASKLRQEDRAGLLDLVEMKVLPDIGDVMVMMGHLKTCVEKDIEEPFDFY